MIKNISSTITKYFDIPYVTGFIKKNIGKSVNNGIK